MWMQLPFLTVQWLVFHPDLQVVVWGRVEVVAGSMLFPEEGLSLLQRSSDSVLRAVQRFNNCPLLLL